MDVKYERRPTPALYTPLGSRVLDSVGEDEPISVPFNTEAGLFSEAGSEAIVLGPGAIDDAHKANEGFDQRWLHADVLDRYVSLIRSICC